MKECDYNFIQTPPDVWRKILELNPIDENLIFFEPFAGENSLFDQVTNKIKYRTEIMDNLDVFDFQNKDEVELIYTNSPFKALIPNKKGEKKYKNCIYWFIDYFASSYKNLKKMGFIINAKGFVSLTPYRLANLAKKGFTVESITVFNTNYWFQTYYFVLFTKNDNSCLKIIEKTFTKK